MLPRRPLLSLSATMLDQQPLLPFEVFLPEEVPLQARLLLDTCRPLEAETPIHPNHPWNKLLVQRNGREGEDCPPQGVSITPK